MFQETKLKLTGWYLVIIMVITFSFSFIVYQGVVSVTDRALHAQQIRLERRFREMDDFPPPPKNFPILDEETLEEVKLRTGIILLGVNIIILVVAGGLGYILAGKTLDPIEQMLKKQKRFISDAAHELKTPLTAIKTGLEVTTRNKKLTIPEAKTAMEDAVDDINGLHLLILKLLEQGKYQNHGVALQKEVIDLSDIVKKVVKQITPLVNTSGLQLQINTIPTPILANQHSMEELIRNLLDNAIKFTPKGKTISIMSKVERKHAILSIQDEGVGMNEGDLQHAFEPFYRADQSRSKTKYDGHGLGLSIAKEIVDSHTGTIEIASVPNHGTTITVAFPVAK